MSACVRESIDALLEGLKQCNDEEGADWRVNGALESLSDAGRELLVQLHYLLPTTIIPALDILDRGAIQRKATHLYFASGSSNGFYEVRTRAWNCTCAAFAYAAYVRVPIEEKAHVSADNWGGLSKNSPVCKHLVAAALVDRNLYQMPVQESALESLVALCM